MGTRKDLVNDLATLLNCASRESCSDTPDFILAEHMVQALENFETAVRARSTHAGIPVKNITGESQ